MTNEKVIDKLMALRCWFEESEIGDSLNMAIAALRNEQKAEDSFLKFDPDSVSKGDVIYRQAAIETTWERPSYTDPLNVLTEVRDRLKALPPAQPDAIPVEWIQKYADDWQDMSCAYENPILGMLEDWRGEQDERAIYSRDNSGDV